MIHLDDVLDPDFWEDEEPLVMDGHPELEAGSETQEELRSHLLFRTSGSSGTLKWIALSKSALWWSAERVVEHLKITSDDVLVLALPVYHVGGFGIVARAQIATCCFLEFCERWEPKAFADFCHQEEVTIASLVPTQVRDLVDAEVPSPPSLRALVVGGGALESELAEKAISLGWPVLASYGMTEAASQIATQCAPGESGLPLIDGWEARMEGDQLAVKGEGLLSAIVTVGKDGFQIHDPKVEGWFLTSDLVDLQGRSLEVLGRADRKVKILGELVDLAALEKFWSQKTGGEVAIIARADERRGKTLHLFYEGDDSEIEAWNSSFPGPERLRDWTLLAQLPYTKLGKINRLMLSEFSRD